MKYSKLFTKTSRDYPSDEVSRNAQLLIRAGFIHKTMAGVYAYLPLGLKVLRNIENIIRDEMNGVGGQELLMTSLQSKQTWEVTDRWSDENVDVWFKSKLKNDTEVGFGWSHEEAIIEMMKNHINSYKDFPANVYQFQVKLRNELRAKSGIMRGREFLMKDMYSCSLDKPQHDDFYQSVIEAYHRVFDRCGVGEITYLTFASGGAFTQFSHEFQTVCDAGEDLLYIDENSKEAYNQEVTPCLANIVDYTSEVENSKEDVYLESVTGTSNLIKVLKIEITRSTKTLFYTDSDLQFVVAVVRSDRNVSEEKLQKIHGKSLVFATEEFVLDKTGAEIGYAGIINLPKDAVIYYDDSLKYMKNFETGTNKTHYHSINICFGRDLEYPEKFYDIKEAVNGDINPNTGNKYIVKKTAETGNIFEFGTIKSEQTKFKFTNQEGKEQLVYLGSYGIGVSRLMGVIAEIYSDEKGLKWPKTVSPFEFHLITNLDKKDEEINQRILDLANKFYTGHIRLLEDNSIVNYDNLVDREKLKLSEWSRHIEVFWDDRLKNNLGEKLKDADLIGIPTQIVISKRSLENGGVEIIDRVSGKSEIIIIKL